MFYMRDLQRRHAKLRAFFEAPTVRYATQCMALRICSCG
jgi:hypothetical protein